MQSEINITKQNFALKKQISSGGTCRLHSLHCTTSSISIFQKQNVHMCFYLSGGQRQIIRVDENATAIVSCPGLAENEKRITISLHKGDTKLHSTDMGNSTQQSLQKFQVFKENSSISYKILRTEANDTGLYCCTNNTHIIQTILLIEGKTRC